MSLVTTCVNEQILSTSEAFRLVRVVRLVTES